MREQLGTAALDPGAQQSILAELRKHADDVDHRSTVRGLLMILHDRDDVLATIAREAQTLIATIPDDDQDDDEPVPVRRPLSERDPDSVDLLRSLVTHIRNDHFTPIVGNGVAENLIGSRRRLAREWARTFEFPLEKHRQDDLPEVAQFVAVMTNTDTLRSSLHDYLRDHLLARLAFEHPDAHARARHPALDVLGHGQGRTLQRHQLGVELHTHVGEQFLESLHVGIKSRVARA